MIRCERVLAFLAILMLLSCDGSSPRKGWSQLKDQIRSEFPEVSQVSVPQLKRMLENRSEASPLLLDVRTENEFSVSHLKGARRAEHVESAFQVLKNEEKDRLVVVYCCVGYRSSRLAEALSAKGFTNIHNLEGSIFEWANRGNPVFRGDVKVQAVHPYNEEWGELLDAPLRSYGDKKMIPYWVWLVGISLFFVVLERLTRARSNQKTLRPQFWNDMVFLAINGHFFAVVTAGIIASVELATLRMLPDSVLESANVLGGRPFLVQFLAYMFAADFLQWCVQDLLHRIPLLWQFHKIHHSAQQIDWAVNFRFHWLEIVIYKSLLYLPLLVLGGDGAPLMTVFVFGTAWGHFNHANTKIKIGPLRYFFNSPSMHLWHHDASSEGGVAKNFGIVLSCWDYLFGTVFWPTGRDPERLGFPGDKEIPRDIVRQELFPLLPDTRGKS